MYSHYGNFSEPSSPLTFTYIARDLEQTRSINSSYSTSTVQRVNQIQPKSKIVIPKLQNKRKPSIGSRIVPTQAKNYESPTVTLKQEVNSPMEYEKMKKPSLFSWNKFTFICGVETHALGDDGCLCSSPCRWRKQWTKNQCKNDYETFNKILRENPKEEHYVQIEKDLLRTYPECPTFASNVYYHGMLKKVLVAYSIYDVDLGYVQGLNMIAGVLLYHIKNPEQTFWALVETMEYQELRMIYLNQFKELKQHIVNIMQIIKLKIPDLHALMEELDIIPECFINGWFLSLMSNCIPIEYMPPVIDKFRQDGWQFVYRLIVTYLLYLKERLLFSNDQAEFLQYLSSQAGREVGAEWPDLIATSGKVYL